MRYPHPFTRLAKIRTKNAKCQWWCKPTGNPCLAGGSLKLYKHFRQRPKARHQRLMPVILATQEAESRRIRVQSQVGQIMGKTLSWKKPITKKDWWNGSDCRPRVQTPALQRKKERKSSNLELTWTYVWTSNSTPVCLREMKAYGVRRHREEWARQSRLTATTRRSQVSVNRG
jgi:hypothetical protein